MTFLEANANHTNHTNYSGKHIPGNYKIGLIFLQLIVLGFMLVSVFPQVINLRIIQRYFMVYLTALAILWTLITNTSQIILFEIVGTKYSFFGLQYMNILYFFPFGLLLTKMFEWKGEITKKDTIPQRHYIFLACFDSLFVFLTAVCNEGTPAILQSVFAQVCIPATLFFSKILLKKKYSWATYVIVFVILVITVVVLVLDGIGKSGGDSDAKPFQCIVFFMSNVFISVSFVLKEWYMKPFDNTEINFGCCVLRKPPTNAHPVHLTTWVAFHMIWITFALVFLQMIPGLGGLTIKELPDAFYGGMLCSFSQDYKGQACDGTWLGTWMWLQLFSVGTFVQGVCFVYLTWKGSALYEYIVSTVCVIVALPLYESRAIMGRFQQHYSTSIYVGAPCLVIAMIFYAATDPEIKKSFSKIQPQMTRTDKEEQRLLGHKSKESIQCVR